MESSTSGAGASLTSSFVALNQDYAEDNCDEELKIKSEPESEADETVMSSTQDNDESRSTKKWRLTLSQAVFPEREMPLANCEDANDNSSGDEEFDTDDEFTLNQSTSASDRIFIKEEISNDELPSIPDDTEVTKEYLQACVEDEKTVLKSQREQLRRERRNRRRKELVNCPHCGKVMNRGSLSKHVSAHNREKRFHCTLCGEQYDRYDYFQRHMAFHYDEKPYKCPECGKGFKEDRKMRKHLLTHSGEKPFICSLCNKAFSDSSALYKHLRSHKGEKPYECSICGKAFNESSKVVRHLRIHTGEKPFECPVCKRAFNDKSSRTKHIRTHKLDVVVVDQEVEAPLENGEGVLPDFEHSSADDVGDI